MESGRGKKGKKPAWHLTLRLKDAVFAGIGIVGLMMMSFALGALAGRGEIYRLAYSWGLLAPEARHAAQIVPQTAPVPTQPVAEAPVATASASAPTPGAAPPPAVPTAKTTASAKVPEPAPVTGAIAPVPAPAAAATAKKQAKSSQAQQAQKAKEDQLRQERQDVAKKLTFLNSFDSTPKAGQKKDKGAAAKAPPAQVKVATYRDSQTAKAKMAELQKKGIKVTLKQGKDDQGATYTVYRQAPTPPKESEKVAQSKEKPGAAAPPRKPQAE